MTNAAFIDTNILLRHFLADDKELSPRASAFLAAVERGDSRVFIPAFVLFETVFTLYRAYKKPKALVREVVLGLLSQPGVTVEQGRSFRRALDVFVDFNISFADAYYVALMEQRSVTEIVSFDRDFDRVPGITRIEP